MSEPALEFRGTSPGPDGAALDHLARVEEPLETAGRPGWACTVRCATLLPRDESISGATAAQALRLAKLFVLDLLDRHNVTIAAADREQ